MYMYLREVPVTTESGRHRQKEKKKLATDAVKLKEISEYRVTNNYKSMELTGGFPNSNVRVVAKDDVTGIYM